MQATAVSETLLVGMGAGQQKRGKHAAPAGVLACPQRLHSACGAFQIHGGTPESLYLITFYSSLEYVYKCEGHIFVPDSTELACCK